MEEEIPSHIPTLLIESHSFTHSVRAYSMSGSELGARHVRQTKYTVPFLMEIFTINITTQINV